MPIALRTLSGQYAPPARSDGVVVARHHVAGFMAALQQKPVAAMQARLDAGHRPYVAHVGGEAAAFGWVATRRARIGELDFAFDIPAGERYLWNFVTLPAFRGRGIYPALLEAILAAESLRARRFWIAWAPENHASAAGIRKAGFQPVAELSLDARGMPAVTALVAGGGAAAARLLGVTEAEERLAACWKCTASGHATPCAAGSCRCDYQRPEVACHS